MTSRVLTKATGAMACFGKRLTLALALAVSAPAAALAANITVSAASSLTNAFRELAPLFEAAHPAVRVRFNFGASGALLAQLSTGAPVDVFASADQDRMDQAHARQLLRPGTRHDFATNRLVVIVPASLKTPAPKALGDLLGPRVARVAIGVPASVPVGSHTRAALEAAQLWPPIERKMVGAQSARQALDYVARAEVDAGFVFATDAALMPDKVRVAFSVPTPQPIRYPVAVLRDAPQPESAERFVRFLLSPPAQAVLARHGFGRP